MPHLSSPPGICLLSTFNELYLFIFYRHYTMAEYAFYLQKGSMFTEVRNLLSWAIQETSSCRSKNLTPRRHTPAVVPTTPTQKPEGPLWPVDTSSQVSTEVAEASLEDIPTSISPIATVSRTVSVTPWWMQWSLRQMPTKPSRIC